MEHNMSLASLRQTLKRSTKVGKHFDTSKHKPWIRMMPLFSLQVALLQFLEIITDFLDSFKPYKTTQDVISDLTFLPLGIRDLINAIPLIPLALLMPIFLSLELMFSGSLLMALIAIPYAIAVSLATLTLGLAQLFRSLTEIIAAPLVLLRMPLRALLTQTNGWPKFEDNPGLNATLDRGEECLKTRPTLDTLEELKDIIVHLNQKAIKAKSYGQNTNLNISKLPHIDPSLIKEKQNFGLPLQKNQTFVQAKKRLNTSSPNEKTALAVNNYFHLFRPSGANESKATNTFANFSILPLEDSITLEELLPLLRKK